MAGGYKWFFSCRDVTGKYQHFPVFAKDKDAAIRKGIAKASRNAGGTITEWHCALAIS